MKFSLPMAFTITMLSWGTIECHDEIVVARRVQTCVEHGGMIWTVLDMDGSHFEGIDMASSHFGRILI